MDFQDPFAIIWSRRWLVVSVVIAGLFAGILAYKLAGPQYRATASVVALGENDAGHDSSANPVDMPTLLLSDSVLTRFEKNMHWKEPLIQLRKRIDASIDINSTLMPISFRAPTQQQAVAGANMLAESLRETYREISTGRYDDLTSYLSTALAKEQAQIDDTDRQLETLVAQNPYVAQKDAGDLISAQVIALSQQQTSLTADLQSRVMAAQLAHERIGTIQPLVRTELLQNDAFYKTLQSQVATSATQQAIVKAQFTSSYPGLPGLNDEVARTQLLLHQEQQRALGPGPGGSPSYAAALKDAQDADVAVSGDQNQLEAISQQLQNLQSHLSDLPDVGVRISDLRLQRDSAVNAYQIFAEQRSITLAEQAEAAALGSIVIADRATEADPALGKASLLMPVAAVLGFMVIAFALPFALELLDPRMRRQTIEAVYGKPVIVTVPA